MRLRCQYLPRSHGVRLQVERGRTVYYVSWEPREGYRITGWGAVGDPTGARVNADYHDPEVLRMMRRTPPAAGLPALPLSSDSKIFHRLPLIREFLSSTAYDDGSPRETATLLCVFEFGVVKVCLNDRAEARSLWVSGGGMDEALDVLEATLAAGKGDWRARTGPTPKKR